MGSFLPRELPERLAVLSELAADLRWTWSHEADALWERIDSETWSKTQNPWIMLQEVSADRLRGLAADSDFISELQRLTEARAAYSTGPGWFASTYDPSELHGIAYFSMEFGLGEALPLYAGGLGVLAGDYLKTASDLGVPAIGIGLLYREGYFRQIVDSSGWQRETYPFNDPGSMPIQPARDASGGWLHIPLDLPGRRVMLRVWHAQIGRVSLYLLDANDPINSPTDRGITGRLYEADPETRLLQDLVLGIAGWRVVEAVAPETEICHLNEGHAAFAVIERARCFRRRTGLSFWEAFWATRAGNVFTTHTPIAAGFDRFSPELIAPYGRYLDGFLEEVGVPLSDLLALGRANPSDANEPFNMAYLAMRGSGRAIGVSRQHEQVGRGIFQLLYPRWPEREVPLGHVINGVHVPSWDSPEADRLWTVACGKERWRCGVEMVTEQVARLADADLWVMRAAGRHALVQNARRHLAQQLQARGEPPETVALAAQVLDPNILTLGFARRFTGYKRPNLLLRDRERLRRLLTDPARPAQLILAGKAHPADQEGKQMIREWILFEREPDLRRRVVFLEDYDLALAQELVQGVDVWINTPRRPWEACGTSGMKVLANGGLNLSVLDGWWEEAYDSELGWAVGDREALDPAARDASDAAELYRLLETEIVPEFYARDDTGIPRAWLARIRASLSRLTPAYSSNRMLSEYVERLYLPAAGEFRRRITGNRPTAISIREWECRLRQSWSRLHIGEPTVSGNSGDWHFSVPVYLGDLSTEDLRVQLYAEPNTGTLPAVSDMVPHSSIPGSVNGHIYTGTVQACRPADDYTVRIIPGATGINIPAELNLILWQK